MPNKKKPDFNIKGFLNAFMWMLVFFVSYNMILEASLNKAVDEYSYSLFLNEVKQGQVKEVIIVGREITAIDINGESKQTVNPGDLGLIGDLIKSNVNIVTRSPKSESFWESLLRSILIILILIAVIMYITNKQSGGKGGIFGIGKSKAKLQSTTSDNITLDDVAGAEEAKEEIAEVVDFLSNPKKYIDMGSKIPRGVLLTGPPGTGKTLIAKAVAGSANVPFYYTSGSDFVEMFVGVGASRVRDMFKQAKNSAPCIIFIDEIDAIGGQRGGVGDGGSEEREQTLNQMLVEMDGFEGSSGVIVIAATNRPETLDRALLRPGRFDRQIVVGLPDVVGREKILGIHSKKISISKDVDFNAIARGTPGFTGADLSNLLNEASIQAARNNKREVSQDDLEESKDKVMMGSERKSMKMDEDDRRKTAYHESGHAIVGRLIGNHDSVYKVSIMPRGRALGITMFLPEKDKYSVTLDELNASIASLYGGRIAEELIYGLGGVSTGASNDIERATQIAMDMVTKWGFSRDLMAINYDPSKNQYGLMEDRNSKQTQSKIDEEVRSIIKENFDKAHDILSNNLDLLDKMTDKLLEFETIDKSQIDSIMSREWKSI